MTEQRKTHWRAPEAGQSRFYRAVGASLLVAAISVAAACDSPRRTAADKQEIFAERSIETGLEFVHFNGMSGQLYFPEMMGAGAALLDYDNDGDLDVYLVQGSALGPAAASTSTPSSGLTDRLFRNDSTVTDNGLRLRFIDVSVEAGLSVTTGYGMGVAAADYDNDGFVDLYVTNFGANQLLRNLGDGRFLDVTDSAGVNDDRWSVSASWADLNGDGLLDLYSGNYVDFDFGSHKPCRSPGGARDYCSPLVYLPQADSLFINNGEGQFTDASKASGITSVFGGALGVISADFNADGLADVYVANDGVANQLWINKGGGRFSNDAEIAGVAVNMAGSPEASMGVAAADFDADGDEDLFMTHLDRETNTLYINDGNGWFEDRTIAAGLGDSSLVFTGFGTGWLDFDNDGLLDLFSANGAVTHIPKQLATGDDFPLKQTNQLFRNNGSGNYLDISDQAGGAFAHADVSRGAALGDIDNDGDIDIVVSNNNGPVRLLLNMVGQQKPWIGLRLMAGKRDDLGARAALLEADRPIAWGRAHTDGSYASSRDPRVLFALTEEEQPVAVRVHWTNGTREMWSGLVPGRYHILRRGEGAVEDPVQLRQ